nr:unnamed protein product [Digitaria exilis]
MLRGARVRRRARQEHDLAVRDALPVPTRDPTPRAELGSDRPRRGRWRSSASGVQRRRRRGRWPSSASSGGGSEDGGQQREDEARWWWHEDRGWRRSCGERQGSEVGARAARATTVGAGRADDGAGVWRSDE